MSTSSKSAARPNPRARPRSTTIVAAPSATPRTMEGMVRPPQQSRSEQNLAKMVAACRALAEERGNLDDIPLQDVVSAAKTSIGAFYSRFKDKDAFLNYVLEVALAEAETVIRQSFATDAVWQDGPAHAIVAHVVHFYLTQFRQNRGLFRGSLRHYAARDPQTNPMRTANRRIIGLAVPKLATHLTDRGAKAAEFESRAAMQFLVGTLSNVLLNDPGPLHLDDDAVETHLVRMMNRYLGVPEPISKRVVRRNL